MKKIKTKALSEYMSLDLIPDPFVIFCSDRTIYDINSNCSNLIGASLVDLIGKEFINFELFRKLTERINQSLITATVDFERITYNNRHFDVFILPFAIEGDLKLIRVVFKDITNFVRLEKELVKRNKELIIINTLSSAFISSENMDIVMENLIEKILLITDFHTCWLLLKEDQNFRLKTSRGISAEFQKSIEEGAFDSLCNETIKKGEPLCIVEPSAISKILLLREEDIVFLTAIPLVCDKNPTGLLFLASRAERDFDFDFAALLSLVGNNVSLILEKIKLFHETKRLAITDGLTGLYNPRYFYETLDFEIARTNRYGNSFSLMLFDIDDFKKINDTYGHPAGDEVLQELAKILKSGSRETDIVVRYGGEEFIIILPSTSVEDTISLANRIKDTVEETTFIINISEGVNITLSGGIASFPQNASNAKSLLYAADSALYSAKAAGKNKIFCFKEKINGDNIQREN